MRFGHHLQCCHATNACKCTSGYTTASYLIQVCSTLLASSQQQYTWPAVNCEVQQRRWDVILSRSTIIAFSQQRYTWHAVNCGVQQHRRDLTFICSTLIALSQQKYAWHAVECGVYQRGWKPEAEGIGFTGRVCWLPESL